MTLSVTNSLSWTSCFSYILICYFIGAYFEIGSYSEYKGEAMKNQINQRNQIYFGICIETIKDDEDKILFEEESRAHFSVRPYGLVNGQETEEKVRKIAKLIDRDIGGCRTRVFQYKGVDITCHSSFHPCIDGKLTRE